MKSGGSAHQHPSPSRPIITLSDVRVQRQETVILDRITLSVMEGEYLGIVGPNGGGKSTLLRLIVGQEKPVAGTVRVNEKKIGYVPQHVTQAHLQFPATVEEVAQTGRSNGWRWGRLTSDDEKAVRNALELAGVEHLKHRLIGDLSGGERQRVFIARALCSEPRLLILDEPLTGVDQQSQSSFFAFIRDLHHRLRLTILFVSHDIDTLTNEVDQIICLNQTLFCHVPVDEFKKSAKLSEVFGHKFKHVHHEQHPFL